MSPRPGNKARRSVRHLFVTNDFPPKLGGIESLLVTLCSGLDPANVAVLAPSRDGHEAVDAALPYDVVRLPDRYLRPTRKVQQLVEEAAGAHDADVVHFLQTFPLGLLAGPVRRALSIPVTIFVHGSGDLLVPSRAPLLRRSMRRSLASADLLLAVSDYTKAAAERFTSSKARVEVLPPAIDVERFSLGVSGSQIRERHGLGERFTVLFVARLVKRKGAAALVRAMAEVPNGVAVIAGTGPEDKALRRLAKQSGVNDRVVFAGSVSDAELPQYYAAADVFCMPCTDRFRGLDTEGLGIVYLEAAASGLPCIAGKCGGSVEAVVHGVTGIVLDHSTPERLGRALRSLQGSESTRAMLGAAARARIEAQFAPPVIAERLEGLVASVTGGKATSAS